MMVRATVDRIEGDWVIIVPESGPVFQVPKPLFPDLREKDAISISVETEPSTQIETEMRMKSIRDGLNRVNL